MAPQLLAPIQRENNLPETTSTQLLAQSKCFWTTQQYKTDLEEAQACYCISAKLARAHNSKLMEDN